jgi:hypothetical protein
MCSQLFRLLAATGVILLAAGALRGQTVNQSGFTISSYVTGLPVTSTVTGMSIDPVSHTLFVAGQLDRSLLRIDPDRNVTNLGNGPTAYASSDLQYFNGNIYFGDLGGGFTITSSSGGGSTHLSPFTNFRNEMGLAVVGSTLYATGGASTPGYLSAFNPTTNTATPLTISGLPDNASSLEYDPISGKLLVATVSGAPNSTLFYAIDLTLLTATLLPATLPAGGNTFGNFAVDPNGGFLYVRQGTTVQQVNILSGAVTPFVTGLTDSTGYADLVFGSSSRGTGQSLYIGDGTSIQEVQGFIPEPTSGALISGGCVSLLLRRRRHAAR